MTWRNKKDSFLCSAVPTRRRLPTWEMWRCGLWRLEISKRDVSHKWPEGLLGGSSIISQLKQNVVGYVCALTSKDISRRLVPPVMEIISLSLLRRWSKERLPKPHHSTSTTVDLMVSTLFFFAFLRWGFFSFLLPKFNLVRASQLFLPTPTKSSLAPHVAQHVGWTSTEYSDSFGWNKLEKNDQLLVSTREDGPKLHARICWYVACMTGPCHLHYVDQRSPSNLRIDFCFAKVRNFSQIMLASQLKILWSTMALYHCSWILSFQIDKANPHLLP